MRRGPVAGHSFRSPVSFDRRVRSGPCHCGQSDAALTTATLISKAPHTATGVLILFPASHATIPLSIVATIARSCPIGLPLTPFAHDCGLGAQRERLVRCVVWAVYDHTLGLCREALALRRREHHSRNVRAHIKELLCRAHALFTD